MTGLRTADFNPADHGLVHVLAVEDGMATPTHPDAVAETQPDYVWIHVNLASETGQRWVRNKSALPPQLASTFLNRSERFGIHLFGSGTLLVVEDRIKEFDQESQNLAKLHIWIESDRVITGRWKPLVAVDSVRFRCEVGKAPPEALDLTLAILGEIIANIERFDEGLHRNLDELEDDLLDENLSGAAGKLGNTRRAAIELRQQVVPLHEAISSLSQNAPPWAQTDARDRLRDLVARVERAAGDVRDTQEQGRLLLEELAARTAERNNRNIYILSLVMAIFMPLNLITSFFGMNVGGLPGVGDDNGFTWVCLGMVAIGIATWLLFKIKKWL